MINSVAKTALSINLNLGKEDKRLGLGIWIEIIAELLKILLGFVLYINEYEKGKNVPLCKTLCFWILPVFSVVWKVASLEK